MIDRLSSLALVPGVLAAFVCITPSTVDELSKSERRKLVKATTEYFEADASEKLEARADLGKLVDDLNEDAERSLLADVEQMQSVLLEARERSNRVAGKGSAKEIEIKRGPLDTTGVVRAPKKYAGDKQTYPLVIVIPDSGQSPEEALQQDWNQPEALEGGVFCAVTMPSDESIWGGFGDGALGGVYHVMFAYGQLVEEYSIHPDRVILAGRGAGVAAAAQIAATFPDRFAAVVGLSGDLDSETPADNFGAISTLWLGAGANAADFAQRTGELGYDNCTNEPSMADADVWTWIDEQRRTAHPTSLRFRPLDQRAGDAYWMRAIGVDLEDASTAVSAEIDRDSNTITIEGSGVSSIQLRFNDLLVDLSQPVKVVVNGVEVERSFERNLSTMLDRVAASADPCRIYVAEHVYDFEAAAE